MKEIEKACITCKYFNILCHDEGIGECSRHEASFDKSFYASINARGYELLVRSNYSCIYWEYYLED